ncbi:hypothetical protein CJ179_38845 [Rhodococcus sp. ACS1]|nr:hypothetical protein CJ179_38845 [Rhodococcus sp. ACS1]
MTPLPSLETGGAALSTTGRLVSVFGHEIEGKPLVTFEIGTCCLVDFTIEEFDLFMEDAKKARQAALDKSAEGLEDLGDLNLVV